MIRGIQREMIMVKTDKSSIFESACFLLRTDIANERPREADMLREANRIIEENYSHKSRKKQKLGRSIKANIPSFLYGSVTGVALFGLIWLIFALK
ncbi:MAG: hypothetical protein J6A83_00790 [Clostridia bacterium]|nr:hypothetical protein [Clostridia bacterium]